MNLLILYKEIFRRFDFRVLRFHETDIFFKVRRKDISIQYCHVFRRIYVCDYRNFDEQEYFHLKHFLFGNFNSLIEHLEKNIFKRKKKL